MDLRHGVGKPDMRRRGRYWPSLLVMCLVVMAAALAVAACTGSPAPKILISNSTPASKLCAEVFGSSQAIGTELGVDLASASLGASVGVSETDAYPLTLECEYKTSKIIVLNLDPASQGPPEASPVTAIGSPVSGVEASAVELQGLFPLPGNIKAWLTAAAQRVDDPPPKS
jgi:hypothetical protein